MSLATSQGFSHPHFIVIKKIWLGLLEGQLDKRSLQLNFQIHLSSSGILSPQEKKCLTFKCK